MKRLTKEIVVKVKDCLLNHPDLTHREVGILCGVSTASVYNIGKGNYDDLLKEENRETISANIPSKEENRETISTNIPYEEFEKLQASKYAVMELFLCTKNGNEDDTLFIDYHIFSVIMRKYFPEDFASRKSEVKNIRN